MAHRPQHQINKVVQTADGRSSGSLNNTLSCLDAELPSPSRRVQLAVITFASRDLLPQCQHFMRYYTQVERIPAADIHVLQAQADALLLSCFGALPTGNIIDLAKGARVTTSSSKHDEGRKMIAVMSKQRELLGSGVYSHTLIADLDEFVMADPARYASLHEYLRINPLRRTAAPANAFEVQVVEAEEGPLDWTAVPLLRGQRKHMVPVCGLRKALLSRVPTRFTFSTHNMRAPLFFACAPDKWGSTANCIDDALWNVHTKCADLALPIKSASLLADTARGGGNVSAYEGYLRRRCGHSEAWRAKCRLGPAWGGRDSPDGEACRRPFRGPGGPEQHMVHVERVPAWLQERL